jgi:perosamine synthetase
MRIGRTLPPAASPIFISDFFRGIGGVSRGQAEIENFKEDLKRYFKVKHCFLLSSGKAALTIILNALQRAHPDRQDVLIPAFTCYSVPSAIVKAGLKVRLCDVNPMTLDIDFDALRESIKLKDRLLAVVCPHLFGLPANIAKWFEVIDDSKITIIEDAAQAMGGVIREGYLGTMGDVGFYSLGRGKAFSTVDGGVIVTNSDQLSVEIEYSIKKLDVRSSVSSLKLIGYALALTVLTNPSFFWLPKSLPGLRLGDTIYNPKFPIKHFSPFQAGLAKNWQKRLTTFQAVRKKNVLFWLSELNRFPWLKPIIIRKEIDAPCTLLRLPVLVQNKSLRNIILKMSHKYGLGIMITYPDPIYKISELGLEKIAQTFPGAKDCADRLLTFPVHGYLSSKDRFRIIKHLEKVQERNYT